MKYASGSDFRKALETRLRKISLQEHSSLARLRKMVAFDRFLARLTFSQPGLWILKGGLALQIRLGERARTTRDIDFLLVEPQPNIHAMLVEATSAKQNDWFEFQVERAPTSEGISERFHVRCLLDGRPFELFHVDIGVGDPMNEEAEMLSMPPLLSFAEIPPVITPCFPISQQIAEKVHAYTRPHGANMPSSRVKDLVDILLMAELSSISSGQLLLAIQSTFEARKTHSLPRNLPAPPTDWNNPFRKLARETGLQWTLIAEAFPACQKFLEPVLQSVPESKWDPLQWTWEPT